MKVFIFATVLAAFVCVTLAAPSAETETRDVDNKNEETNVENAETVRTKKNAYQPAPAPAYKHAPAPAPAYKAAPAPEYHHAAPEYHQEVHAGPAKAYSYPSPAPKVKCPSSLLLSCQPNVAHVPCVSPPAHYGYAAPAHYGHAAPAHYGHAAPAPHHY